MVGITAVWQCALTELKDASCVPWPAAKVAMLSAKEHSPNLIPVLLYGDSSGGASAAASKNILWYREQGGIVYHHNLTFMSDLQASKLAAGCAHSAITPRTPEVCLKTSMHFTLLARCKQRTARAPLTPSRMPSESSALAAAPPNHT